MATLPDEKELANDLARCVQLWNANTDRGRQTAEHLLGISDIGHCREYARWMTIEQEFTDDPLFYEYVAFVGNWIGSGVEQAVTLQYPVVKTQLEIQVTLPSGAVYTGHPDLVLPNGVLDIKTVDGLTSVELHGPTEAQQFQRHLYAAGLIQAGILGEDCWVGNAWFDRSGRTDVPHVQLESYDPTWLNRADEWIDDVLYAVRNNERTVQDMPLEWCERCCPFFTVCRGEDARKDRESQGLITDPFNLSMIDKMLEAKEQKKAAEKVIEDARRYLANVSGSTGSHILRWVFVDESSVPGYTRRAYHKLDLRPIPKGKVTKS